MSDFDADAGKYTFYVHGLDAPDPEWSLRLGDCIHNARTALDYLIVRLAALVSGQTPADIDWIGFPIQSDPDAGIKATAAKVRKYPNFSGYLTRIEELQPYNLEDPSIWGQPYSAPLIPAALARLARLDNVDKHRVIHAVWAGIQFNLLNSFPNLPPGFSHVTGSLVNGALQNDAEIGHIQFATPLPSQWEPEQVDMKRHFRIHVALDEPLPFQGVLEIGPFVLWGVEAVLRIFDPVFKHGRPPLAVTAIPEPELKHTPQMW